MASHLSAPLSKSSGLLSNCKQPEFFRVFKLGFFSQGLIDCFRSKCTNPEDRAGAHERVSTMNSLEDADGEEGEELRTYSDTASGPVMAILDKIRAVPAKLTGTHLRQA